MVAHGGRRETLRRAAGKAAAASADVLLGMVGVHAARQADCCRCGISIVD